MKTLNILSLLICMYLNSAAQKELKVFHISSSHTAFPDTGRAAGHAYNKILYDAATHYSDSSVLIIVPPRFISRKKFGLVFWFHGWGNNIDSAAVRYNLINQFINANKNAVLVLAETAKNAPDSYGGKLEKPNDFKELVNDVMNKLKTEKIVSKGQQSANVILAGHSGAYRVMANILQKGNVEVKEIILFDALYAETDKFIQWLKADTAHRFINTYTNNGGTDTETSEMIKKLKESDIPTYKAEESDMTPNLLQQHRIIVIHSLHKHDDIISDPDNFKLFLENSMLLDINK